MPKSKKNRKESSSTPGKSKGPNCQKSQLKNLYCKDTKMYKKNPKLWLAACEEVSKMKGNLPTSEVLDNRRTMAL